MDIYFTPSGTEILLSLLLILIRTPSPIITNVLLCSDSHFVLPRIVLPTLLTLLGTEMFSREVQSLNAYVPIYVIPSGIITDFNEVFPLKAESPIYLTVFPPMLDGITTSALLPLYPVIVKYPFASSNTVKSASEVDGTTC